MSAIWRKHPNKKGKLQEIDLGMCEADSQGNLYGIAWRGQKGVTRATSSSQKYAEGWDRIFGKEQKA